MKGFPAQYTVDVTLTRGDDSLTLTLHALPPGWRANLRSAFPAPLLFAKGKEPVPDPAKTTAWWESFTRLQIGKSLAPSGVLSTQINGRTRSDWVAVDKALSAEFAEANLTDGDLATLAEALRTNFLEAAGGDQGN